MRKLLGLLILLAPLCAHAQFASISRGPLSGNCNPHTLGIDYLGNNVYSCDGTPAQWKLIGAAAVGTPSGTKAVPNCNAAGTVLNQTVQESSQTINGVTTTCATVGAIGSTSVIGVCSILGQCGTLGTAVIGTANTMPCIFDNTATVGDYVIPSSTIKGFCSDIGPAKPSNTVETIGNVYQSNNGGAGTIGFVEVAPLSLLLPGSTGSGSINNCAQVGAVAYYSGLNNISCDILFTTDGNGNVRAVSLGLTGTGAGFMYQVQGPAPALSVSNAVYLFPPTSVGTTYGLSWPGSLPTNGHCVQFSVSGSIAQFTDAGSACGSGAGSVTSVGLTINGGSSSGPVSITGSPITTSGTFNLIASFQGTDSKLLTSGTVSGTGAALCTDANGGATTSGCSPTQVIQVNGTPITTESPANFENGNTSNGLQITISNPSVGNVQPALVGPLPTFSQVPQPRAPTLANNNAAGARSITYAVVACQDTACTMHTQASSTATIANANASPNVNLSLYWPTTNDTSIRCFNIYVTVDSSRGTLGLIGTCVSLQFTDTGANGDGSTAPVTNTTVLKSNPQPLPGCPVAEVGAVGIDAPQCALIDGTTDEFTETAGFSGTTISDPRWTCTSCGTSSFTLTNGELSFTPQNNATDQWRLVTQTTPATPWSYVIASYMLPTLNQNLTQICGMVVTDGTKIEHWGFFWQNTSPNWSLRMSRYTNSTTFSAFQFTGNSAGIVGGWIYFKVQNDGTNLNFSYSYDGVTYMVAYSEAKAAFLANTNNVGFGCDAPSTSVNPIMVMDYFRRTQ